MTRILVLSNMYPPHYLGGYELTCRDVVDRLRDRGHQIEILATTMRLSGVEDPPDERRLGVRRDLVWYWEDHRILKPSLRRRLHMERHNQATLIRVIEETQPEVVSAWHMGAMSMGLLTTVVERGIPLVLSLGDEWPVYGPEVDPWAKLFVDRPRFARAARRITGVPTAIVDLGRHAAFLYGSEAIRTVVEERSSWRAAIASIVYPGIDDRDFPPSAPPDHPWRWRLLHVGRIDERKGIHLAIDALKMLPDEATLAIHGRGDDAYLERLHAQIRDLGLEDRVRFAVTPRESLRDVYRDADAFVFPPIWAEPFGLVPLEAMACGTPVVATGTGGSGEFLLDEINCLRIPVDDAAALAAAVERLASDPHLRTRLIEAGVRTASQLTVDRFADETEEWLVAAAQGFGAELPRPRMLDIS